MNIEQREEKPKVVLDSNVIISGLNFSGNENKILNLAREGEIKILISPFILSEVEGILSKKFGWSKEQIRKAIEELQTILIKPKKRILIIKEDESDNRILECGVEGKARCIVSEDRHHLLPLKSYKGIKVLNSTEFLKIY